MTRTGPDTDDDDRRATVAPSTQPPSPTDDDDRYRFYGESPDARVRYRGWLRPGSPAVTIDGHLNTQAAIATTVEVMRRVFEAAGPDGRSFFHLYFYRSLQKYMAPIADTLRRHVDANKANVTISTPAIGQHIGDLMELAHITLRSARIDVGKFYEHFVIDLNGEIR